MQLKKRFGITFAALLASAGLVLSSPGGATASPTTVAKVAKADAKPTPVSGKQAKPAIKAGEKKATKLTPKGKTEQLKLGSNGRPSVAAKSKAGLAGYVSGVDFSTAYNYCDRGWTYTPVNNTTAATKYLKVELYNGSGASQTFYTSVGANSSAWPYFLGVSGSWYAYLYVWDGSQYAYDEYLSGSNNCNVSVSFTAASGYTGYVKFTVKNNGNAYTSVNLRELAPYASYGTYTGSHWVYPAAGATVVQYLYVGTGQPYGVYSDVYGALNYGTVGYSGTL